MSIDSLNKISQFHWTQYPNLHVNYKEFNLHIFRRLQSHFGISLLFLTNKFFWMFYYSKIEVIGLASTHTGNYFFKMFLAFIFVPFPALQVLFQLCLRIFGWNHLETCLCAADRLSLSYWLSIWSSSFNLNLQVFQMRRQSAFWVQTATFWLQLLKTMDSNECRALWLF